MRRREFVGGLAGAAAWPIAAHAQQPAVPVIGFLNSQSADSFSHLAAAFLRGLSQSGFTDGQNVTVEFRWAEGRYERLPELVSDLVRRQVAVLVATGGEPASLAAKAATSSIPIVFAIGGDPVKGGFVNNLARPGGNMTGLTQFTEPLEGKRLALLHELTSKAEIGALLNPNFPPFDLQLKALNDAAERLSVRLIPAFAREEREFEPAFKELLNKGAGAMLAASDPFFNSHREKLVALAASHKLPAIYEFREYAAAGGLMSYGASLADGYRLVGIYTGQILKGSRPADLPVLQPTKFELVINLKTARTSRIEMPLSLLRSADEVIE